MAAMTNALATNISINPGLPGINNVSTVGPAGWIAGFYNFALIIAGILAFGAIVYGGVKAATSAGNPSGISEGRAYIYSALLGLLLLGCAWLILNTINPNLTKLQVPTLSTVNTSGGINVGAPCGSSYCSQGQQCTTNGTCVAFSANQTGGSGCSTIMCGSTCCASGQTCSINITTHAQSCQ